jgi:hypothetical protein
MCVPNFNRLIISTMLETISRRRMQVNGMAHLLVTFIIRALPMALMLGHE